MLIGEFSWLAYGIASEFVGLFPRGPLWYLIPIGVICSLFGGLGMVNITCFAYLSDIIPIREQLTIRMAYFSAAVNLGGLAASLIGALIADLVEMTEYMAISIGFNVVMIIYTFIVIKQVHPVKMRQLALAKLQAHRGEVHPMNGPAPKHIGVDDKKLHVPPGQKPPVHKNCCQSFFHMVVGVGIMTWKSLKTFGKPRRGYRRLYLILCALVFIVYMACIVEMHNSVTAYYTYRRPLLWTPGQFQLWRLAETVITLIGKVLGVIVFVKLCKLGDTSLILISMVSIIAESILIGFSQKTWMMYLAASVAFCGYMGLPAFKSFVAKLVAIDEVGQVMSIFSIGADLGILLAMAVFNSVYSATVHTMPNAVFFMIAGLVALCFLVMLLVHVMYRIDLAREKKEDAKLENGMATAIEHPHKL